MAAAWNVNGCQSKMAAWQINTLKTLLGLRLLVLIFTRRAAYFSCGATYFTAVVGGARALAERSPHAQKLCTR